MLFIYSFRKHLVITCISGFAFVGCGSDEETTDSVAKVEVKEDMVDPAKAKDTNACAEPKLLVEGKCLSAQEVCATDSTKVWKTDVCVTKQVACEADGKVWRQSECLDKDSVARLDCEADTTKVYDSQACVDRFEIASVDTLLGSWKGKTGKIGRESWNDGVKSDEVIDAKELTLSVVKARTQKYPGTTINIDAYFRSVPGENYGAARYYSDSLIFKDNGEIHKECWNRSAGGATTEKVGSWTKTSVEFSSKIDLDCNTGLTGSVVMRAKIGRKLDLSMPAVLPSGYQFGKGEVAKN